MQVRKMRLLRHKYGISNPDLSRICGLSPQRVSEIELSGAELAPGPKRKLLHAFHTIAEQRQASAMALCDDLSRHENSLFDTVEESDYEL